MSRVNRTRRRARVGAVPHWRLALLCATTVGLAACGGSDDGDVERISLQTLGNRADLVSGGDALLGVTVPATTRADTLRLNVNGQAQSATFAPRGAGRYDVLVTGLVPGANTVTVTADGAARGALDITNHDRGGPILSGPQPQPYVCATPVAQPASGDQAGTNASGLTAAPIDANCTTPSEYQFYYRSTQADCVMALPDPNPPATPPANACFRPYAVGQADPADLATTQTHDGRTVPYVVRVERGTLNRGIYDLAVLVDPTQPWDSGAQPQDRWASQVLFSYGGSGGQPRRQARPASSWVHDEALSRGWLVAVSSLTDGALNSNRIVSAETTMMLKEHITDRYGPPRFTVAEGCSGGSMTGYAVVSTQPGLLDGLLISCSLFDPDTSHTESNDCALASRVYDHPAWRALMTSQGYTQTQINERRAAINGTPDHTACQGWLNSFGRNLYAGNSTSLPTITAADTLTGRITTVQQDTPFNLCQLPASQVWDPINNPDGVRCGQWDWAASVFGLVPGSRQANTTRDNVGVQYGYTALQAGKITPEEFVMFNELIGSSDRDGVLQRSRVEADTFALETVYRSGLVMSPRRLAEVPIIDMRGYDDATIAPPGVQSRVTGLHPRYRSFGVRDRLLRGNGHHDNHAMWEFATNGYVPTRAMVAEALDVMQAWLVAAEARGADVPLARAVADARPAAAADFCYLSDDPAQVNKVYDAAVCRADPLLAYHGSLRTVAGSSLGTDVLKCQRKPLASADYLPATFTAEQWSRLNAVFPQGVCDYTQPGVGQQEAVDGILSFAAGPGGQPLPPAPVSY